MWRQAAYVFPLHGTPFVFHSSWRPDVFSWCFSYRLWKNILYYRWITTNFRQYNWSRKANKRTVYSKSGCKFSPEQEQNAELKFNASNKEEDDSRKNIALPSEEEAIDDRRKDSCHCGIFFFCCFCIQFNSFLLERRGTKHSIYNSNETDEEKELQTLRESTANKQWIPNYSVVAGEIVNLEVCSRNSAYDFFRCNDRQ